MMQAAKEPFENNLDHIESMKNFANTYKNKRECSVREAGIKFCWSFICEGSFQEFTLQTQICKRNDHYFA